MGYTTPSSIPHHGVDPQENEAPDGITSSPATTEPSSEVIRRLAERYGSLDISEGVLNEASADARWDMILDDESSSDEKRAQMSLLKPWRALRYIVWRSPPRRLLLVSDNLPDSQVSLKRLRAHSTSSEWLRRSLSDRAHTVVIPSRSTLSIAHIKTS